jgi:hypothetical protein
MRIALALLLAVSLLGCSSADDERPAPAPAASAPTVAAPTPTAAEIASSYTTLQKITKDRVFVDPGLAMLCRGASQKEVDAARKVSGPHAHTAITIYMNDPAADAFRQATTPYPVGSVVVKQKAALSFRTTTQPNKMTKPHDGVGGMIKRPAGYDPANGDWEYFYFEDPAKLETGRIESCVQCHQSAAAKDHVFGGWAAEPKPGR